jgi:thiol-disulfide isomerase/thioredoxin
LKSLSGENIRLQEQMGEVILLNFWATWCGPCREEMPELEKLQQKYQTMGFKVLGVNVETTPEKAQAYLKKISVSFPILFDTEQSVSKAYQVEAMPTTYIIDRHGKLRYVHKGYEKGTEADYDAQIKKLIRE